MKSVELRRISFGSLAKLGFWASLALWLTAGLLMGIGALSGVFPVDLNGTKAVGIAGFFGAIFVALMFALFQTVAFVLGMGLLRIAARLLPNLALTYAPDSSTTH